MAFKCIGHATDADLAAASGLPSLPEGCDMAIISVEGGNVRWRADGTDPTNDTGHILYSAGQMEWRGPFSAIKFIEDSAADTPTITVSYYSFG